MAMSLPLSYTGLLLLGLVHMIAAQGAVTGPAAGLTPEGIQTILDVHNKARKAEPATDMPDLIWNADLALKAQNWTDACKFAHQPPRRRQWGENIAAVGNTRTLSGQVTAMIDEWTSEKKFNKGGTFSECCSFSDSKCCHYSQVIWAATTDVGCGYTVCESLEYGNGALNDIAYLACYYTPAGNRPRVTYDWRPYIPLDTPTSAATPPQRGAAAPPQRGGAAP